MLIQEDNPGIDFEYSMPSGAVKAPGDDRYVWSMGDWSEWSDECGTESKRTRRIWCNNEATLEIVDDFLCGDQRAKPEDHEACQGKPCKPEWQTSEWSNCTALAPDTGTDATTEESDEEEEGSGGGGDCPGFMFRNVFCHQAGDGIIDDSLCDKDIAGDKPDVAKVCDEEEGEGSGSAGPQYHAGPWGGCSALCGDGLRKRVVTCYEKNENDTIVKLEDEQCIAVEDLIRPEDEEQCTADKKCETYNWITTPWAGCSDGEEGEGSPTVCGLDRKLESRSILCSDADGNITEVGAALGDRSGNMTDKGNTTSSTLCSPDKIP